MTARMHCMAAQKCKSQPEGGNVEEAWWCICNQRWRHENYVGAPWLTWATTKGRRYGLRRGTEAMYVLSEGGWRTGHRRLCLAGAVTSQPCIHIHTQCPTILIVILLNLSCQHRPRSSNMQGVNLNINLRTCTIRFNQHTIRISSIHYRNRVICRRSTTYGKGQKHTANCLP
jgi:hypothetical protein